MLGECTARRPSAAGTAQTACRAFAEVPGLDRAGEHEPAGVDEGFLRPEAMLGALVGERHLANFDGQLLEVEKGYLVEASLSEYLDETVEMTDVGRQCATNEQSLHLLSERSNPGNRRVLQREGKPFEIFSCRPELRGDRSQCSLSIGVHSGPARMLRRSTRTRTTPCRSWRRATASRSSGQHPIERSRPWGRCSRPYRSRPRRRPSCHRCTETSMRPSTFPSESPTSLMSRPSKWNLHGIRPSGSTVTTASTVHEIERASGAVTA